MGDAVAGAAEPHRARDLLRFATAGSVDDGKSTLVGRLLYDTKSVLADQIEAVQRASVDKGLTTPDLSLLVEELLTLAFEDGRLDPPSQPKVTPGALERLSRCSWPGNVRELRNVILAAMARAGSAEIDEATIEAVLAAPGASASLLRGSLEDILRAAIRDALRDCNGHRRAAARRLGIAESTLYLKIKQYGLEREGISD